MASKILTKYYYESKLNPGLANPNLIWLNDPNGDAHDAMKARRQYNVAVTRESELGPLLNWNRAHDKFDAGNEEFFQFFHNFEDFHVGVTHYHVAQNIKFSHPIEVFVLIPKSIAEKKPKTCPVNVKWHGGGSVTGDAIFPPWFARHFLEVAEDTNSIIVVPNYRLLPETDGKEMLLDVEHFWNWYKKTDFNKILDGRIPKDSHVDKECLLVSGESAGGLLAVYSWMACDIPIKALYLLYPMLKKYKRAKGQYMGEDVDADAIEKAGKALYDATHGRQLHLAPRSSASPPDCMVSAMTLATTDYWGLAYDATDSFDHINTKEAPTQSPQKIVIVHGNTDKIVLPEVSTEFLRNIKLSTWKSVNVPSTNFISAVNCDHGFDYNVEVYRPRGRTEHDQPSPGAHLEEAWELIKPVWIPGSG